MKEKATRLWEWIRQHRVWSSIILIVLLGVTLYGTIYLIRFGLPPTGQNCGSLQYGNAFFAQDEDGTVRADVTVKPLNCFWRAYQTCQAATISQTLEGTDAGHTDTLTTEQRGNRCVIYGHEDYWANTDRGSGSTLCTQLHKEGDDLQVSGCDGANDLTLYSRDPTVETADCGVVNATLTDVQYFVWKAENCFFVAYQQCLADMMAYRQSRMGSRQNAIFISIIVAQSPTAGVSSMSTILSLATLGRSWQPAPAW